jgi:hypothetical protein
LKEKTLELETDLALFDAGLQGFYPVGEDMIFIKTNRDGWYVLDVGTLSVTQEKRFAADFRPYDNLGNVVFGTINNQ